MSGTQRSQLKIKGPAVGPVPSLMEGEMIQVINLGKTFTLHLAGPAVLTALDNVSLSVQVGRCLALTGPSGSGKSTLLRCIYGNYRLTTGDIILRHALSGSSDLILSMRQSTEREILTLRHHTLGYVSQFLRVIPRISALEVVMEPLLTRGIPKGDAQSLAEDLLDRLHIPRKLQNLPPATFSGGERQRVNIARGLIWPAPILLLDEPTASLDAANKNVVCELIEEAKAGGAAVIGVFHDQAVCERLADEILPLLPPKRRGK
jgi:alpha-D-ribose 1-methylphosphonate 5-triphosphate synthase subunit PhnL